MFNATNTDTTPAPAAARCNGGGDYQASDPRHFPRYDELLAEIDAAQRELSRVFGRRDSIPDTNRRNR